MNVPRIIRGSGLAAIASSGLAILLTIPALNVQDRWPHVLQHGLMMIGLSGIYLYQYREVGRLGLGGLVLAFLGAAAFLLPGQIAGMDSLALGGLGTGVGVLMLAIASIGAGKFPLWIPGFWIAGAVIGVPATFFISYESYLLLASAILFAVGFVGAGLQLLAYK